MMYLLNENFIIILHIQIQVQRRSEHRNSKKKIRIVATKIDCSIGNRCPNVVTYSYNLIVLNFM